MIGKAVKVDDSFFGKLQESWNKNRNISAIIECLMLEFPNLQQINAEKITLRGYNPNGCEKPQIVGDLIHLVPGVVVFCVDTNDSKQQLSGLLERSEWPSSLFSVRLFESPCPNTLLDIRLPESFLKRNGQFKTHPAWIIWQTGINDERDHGVLGICVDEWGVIEKRLSEWLPVL